MLAICGVGQGPTLAVVDASGEPVRPAITWQDRRPTAGGSGGFGLLPTMAWLAREEPDASAERAAGCSRRGTRSGLWLSGEAAASLQGHETALDEATLLAAGVRPSVVPAARGRSGRGWASCGRTRPRRWACGPGSR